MKKSIYAIFIALIVITVLMFIGCEPDVPDSSVPPENTGLTATPTESSETPSTPDVTYDGEARLVLEDEKYKIILPELEAKLGFREEYEKYIPYVTDELLIKAEKELLKDIGAYRDSAAIYLSKDNEGYLCLSSEAILKINPPRVEVLEDGTVISDGCNIDHEHVFFSKRISTKSLN